MSDNLRLIKLVSGNSGSKRITIPRDVVEKLGIRNSEYIAMVCDDNKKCVLAPAKVARAMSLIKKATKHRGFETS